MLRLIALLLATITALALSPVSAQTVSQAQAGDPPLVALINVSNPDANGIVEIAGVAGAVPPNARLAIRNLYTEETLYAQAGITGSFRVNIFGPGNTPFWISVVTGEIPQALRGRSGSLPGGPGTIIYGPFPESRQATAPVTQLVLDADLTDWETYPRAMDNSLYGLLNQESLYLAASELPAGTVRVQAIVTIDTNTFEVTVDLAGPQQASARRIAPQENTIGTIPAVFAANTQQMEVRVPIRPLDERYETVTLVELRLLGAEGNVLSTRSFNQILTPTNEVDGIVRLDSRVGDDPTRFTVGGPVAGGASYWSARGRVDRLRVNDRTAPLQLELDVALTAPSYSPLGTPVRMVGQLGLLPLVANIGGEQTIIPAPLTNNGWSTLQTSGGIAIDNMGEVINLGETTIDLPQIVFRNGQLIFGLSYEIRIPDEVPLGMYVPVFQGYVEIGEARIPWEANGLFGAGNRISQHVQTRLPIVLNLGEVQPVHLLWTLFDDTPSRGARGLLAEVDQQLVALSNRTQFNSPTYILPPNNYATGQPQAYSLEPYMLNQMPNAYATTSAPLVPFLLPGGRLVVAVTTPDGRVNNLGSTPILQNQLSTSTLDERERYSESSPLDMYRLTTLNPLLRAYTFNDYGEHVINLVGTVEDVWGNRYEGGGSYRVLIAEPLDISPGVLPGTPFEVGDAFNPVVRLLPGLPAEVTVRLRVYPLGGGPVQETTFAGQANRFGYFHPLGEAVRFGVPGEYVVDYEARYTDSLGRLWAGSMRSAGVIANPVSGLIAHGARGLSASGPAMRPAWFDASHYAGTNGVLGNALFPNLPYHSGDVAWVIDGDNGGLQPFITVQDTNGTYAGWLENLLSHSSYRDRAVRQELPVTMLGSADAVFGPALAPESLVNEGYTYFSAARAGVTARQMVLGAEGGTLTTLMEPDDRYNYQTGAGLTGDRPGDFLFLFGGVVVRNTEAQLVDSTIYAALSMIVPENDPRGTRVFPPFGVATGGPNGGPLLTVAGQPVDMFFVPTATQPGTMLTLGDTLSIAGQVAPTLPSTVTVVVTSPSGIVRQFEADANAIGYFYSPQHDIVTDEAGVWTVDVGLRHDGLTSAGPVEPPVPTGTILKRPDDRYVVYVVPPEASLLPLERNETIFPPALRYNISFSVPAGWLDVRVDYSLTMPGHLMDEGQLPVTGNSFSFSYSPDELRARFPNFEVDGRVTGPWVSDPLTLTILMSGTDNRGLPNMMMRQIHFINDRLLSLNE